MKNVVITGSARGFGYAMAEEFAKLNCNIVLSDVNKNLLLESKEKLQKSYPNIKVLGIYVDVTNLDSINKLITDTLKEFNTIDIWINNAGVNQPEKPIWELEESDINKMVDIDLKGTILSSKAIMPIMIKQNSGQIFNVEGYGSDNATRTGLSIYGTAKRAVTYFTEVLTKEVDDKKYNIQIGKITPGIMITNFLTHSLGDGEEINLDEKTKKVYNILGDYPETIAHYTVPRILKNNKNGAKIMWLTSLRAMGRFMTAGFRKRDLLK